MSTVPLHLAVNVNSVSSRDLDSRVNNEGSINALPSLCDQQATSFDNWEREKRFITAFLLPHLISSCTKLSIVMMKMGSWKTEMKKIHQVK